MYFWSSFTYHSLLDLVSQFPQTKPPACETSGEFLVAIVPKSHVVQPSHKAKGHLSPDGRSLWGWKRKGNFWDHSIDDMGAPTGRNVPGKYDVESEVKKTQRCPLVWLQIMLNGLIDQGRFWRIQNFRRIIIENIIDNSGNS